MQTDGTNIAGKVVVITGASSGLGEATARYLADRGATVVLGARRMERLQTLVDEITRADGTAFARVTDVTAVRVITEGLRQEVKPWNLRATIISPGAAGALIQSPVGNKP